MNVMTPEYQSLALPTERLASLTCDGAPVVLYQKNGVAGKLKASVNPKLFITHCPPQIIIPDNVDKLIGDLLFFFTNSPVHREEFHKLKELVEPGFQKLGLLLLILPS